VKETYTYDFELTCVLLFANCLLLLVDMQFVQVGGFCRCSIQYSRLLQSW